MDRREFLKKASMAAGALAFSKTFGDLPDAITDPNEVKTMPVSPKKLPRRKYGKHSITLSVIGFGGIVLMGSEQDHCDKIVGESIEKGVNYFDVAPSYGRGEAEAKLGPALEPYRKGVFLACKTTHRHREAAQAEFKQSLERLRTDYFDLYQLHALNDVTTDVDAAFAEDGIINWLIEAKKSGQIRHLGFSAHSEAAALAAMDRYEFDSILFPVDFSAYYQGNFGHQVIAKAKRQGIAILALKALARQKWPADDPLRKTYPKCWYKPITDPDEARLAMRFTLSQPVTAAVPPGEEALYRLALDLAMDFQSITAEETRRLQQLAKSITDPLFTTPQA